MDSKPYAPTGYCPHCGHAIDPGICQECGREVTARTLRRRPLRKTAWGTAIIILVVASMFIAYQRANWIYYIPTNVLLWAQGDAHSRTANELGRRFNLLTLPGAEIDRFVSNAVQPPSQLVIRDPHPAGETIRIGLKFSSQLPWRHCSTQIVPGNSTLNSAAVRVSRGAYRWGRGVHTENFHIRSQEPGEYRLEIRCTLHVTPRGTGRGGGWTREFVLTKDFTVASTPLSGYVDVVFGDDLADRVRNGVHLAVKGRQFGIWITDDAPTIVGRAYYREPPGQKWTRVYVYPDGGIFRSGFNNINRFSATNTAVEDHVDLKIVADGKLAFDAGLTEYFGGVIEWSDVPVDKSGDLTFYAPDHRREKTYPLTRVYPIGESPDASATETD